MALRDASELIYPAVTEAIAGLALKPEDAAAVRLAERYAQIIDESRDHAWAGRWLMPLLLDTLTALGATPAARAALNKGVKQADAAPESQLEKLRKARTQ